MTLIEAQEDNNNPDEGGSAAFLFCPAPGVGHQGVVPRLRCGGARALQAGVSQDWRAGCLLPGVLCRDAAR